MQVTRPFVAADSSTDMTIYADPDNSGGYSTTYTFRSLFGPTAASGKLRYQCEDQTIDFANFYAEGDQAMSLLLVGGLSAALTAILF